MIGRAAAFVTLALVCGLHGARALTAPAPVRQVQDRPVPADGIVRLLLDLEGAISSGRIEEFRAIATPTVTAQAVSRFQAASRGDGRRAIVRERARRANGDSFDVVAEVLVSQASLGRIATWQILAVAGDAPGQFRIDDLRELAAVDGLLRLRLDTDRQFAVKDLVINAPDLTVKMASGSAFVAESPNGITALVLRGKSEVAFTPPDPAEQGQVRIFAGRPSYRAPVDAVFLRINPAEFVLRVSDKSLTPTKTDPGEAARALQIFDDMVSRTYNVDLRNLTPELWSLEPSYGNLVLELRTRNHGWLTYAKSPVDHEDISFFDRGGQRNISLYVSTEKQATRGRAYNEDDGAAFDIEHHRLNLSFDPSRMWVSGRASVQMRITASSVSSVTIRLAQPLAVASVSSATMGDLLALRIVGQNNILVGLPSFVERGAELTLDVVYGGRLESQALDREAIAPQGQRQNEQEQQLIITPEARYLYSNRVPWYPQGSASDYATAEMQLSVPSQYQVVASGSLLRSSVVANQDPGRSGSKSVRVVDYVADRPVRYLACVISRFIAIGRSRVDVPAVSPPVAARGGGAPAGTLPANNAVNLDVVSTSRMTTRNRQTPQRVAAMLQYFARLIGEAPYPDFTLAALDDNLPGGHSPAYFAAFHQALPTTPYSWASDPVAFDDVYPQFFLAHEVAHQWWGQAVGWKNYHEQWLSEGLAQYFAALYAAEDRGPAMLETLVGDMREAAQPYLAQGPISLGYRLGHIKSDGRVFRAIVYNKSAVVLHMLRRLVGDEAFFAGVRRFYAASRFKKAGTGEFQAALEAGGAITLDRFFEGWVRGAGRPRVRLSWSGDRDAQIIRVEQIGEIFTFPLTVAVQYADGRSEQRTIKVVGGVTEERLTATPAIRRVTARDPLTFFETTR